MMASPFLTLAGWNDIFHEILNILEPEDDYDYDEDDYRYEDHDDAEFAARVVFRGTLLSLALSCRAFLDPSLDKLWNDLHSIHAVFNLLPNFQLHGSTYVSVYIFVLHALTSYAHKFGKKFAGNISPDAWARLQTYATRVHTINVFLTAVYAPSVWPTVLKQCHGKPLFPNLRTLRLVIRWEAPLNRLQVAPAQCLAASSLRALLITSNADQGVDAAAISTVTARMLQEFASKSPRLSHLSCLPYRSIGCEHLRCLSQFVQMEGLVLNSYSIVDEDLLVVLSNLKNLTNLEASISLQDPSDARQLDLKAGFQRLIRLDLKLHCPPEYLTRFILATSMPRLEDLSLLLSTRHVDGVLTSFPAIWHHIGPHKLTRLRVGLGDFEHPPLFLMELLEPLLPFSKLQELEFLFQEHLPLCDEDLSRFARAWPQLHALLFRQSDASLANPNREPGALARPTLSGLVELARGCPKLVCICIPDLDVSASALPKAEDVPLLRHGLLDLCIQNLVGAEDSERQLDVAVVLDRLFPRVKLEFKIRGPLRYDNNPNPHVADLVNVSRLVRAMRIAREHYPGGV